MKMFSEFDHKKATQAMNYLTKKEGGQIDKLKLIKLVYFADRFHLRRYGRPISNDIYLAMPLGPVGSSIKDIAEFSDFLDETEREYAATYLGHGGLENTIVSIADVDIDVFSKSELKALDFAYNEFGSKSALALVDITHRYPEWDKFKRALESKETTRESMSYLDFFKNPSENVEDKFALSADVLSASKELFEEGYRVAECWK
ncbi:MAG: Panacea domain-containing protein [Candidatus Parcubacteria bacterium]|nr:Panacea domain-containing protein [Candidatus Parcubacteria bacterium]